MVKCTKRQIRQLKTALHWKIPDLQRQRIRMVLLREGNMTQPAIAEAMGVSLSTVNRAHMAYDQGGIKALKPKPCGGRQRENMTMAAEQALLARFAKAAGAGEMLNIHDLKSAYEQAIGHPTSNSTIYNLLDRHHWRKLMPRPFHPQRDVAAQNAFKKRLFSRREASARGRRKTRPSPADHVRRRSAVRPHQPATAVLGAGRHPAAGGFPAHSRIHLFVRRGRAQGRHLRLSDHADIEHRMLSGIP